MRVSTGLALGLLLAAMPARAQDGAESPAPPDAADVFAEGPEDEASGEPTVAAADVSTEAPSLETHCPEGLECHRGRDGVVRAYRRRREHREGTDLIIIGSVMLGAAWVANIGASIPGSILLGQDTTSGTRSGDYLGWSFVPVIGPVAQMFQLGDEHWAITLLAVVEAVEIVGIVIAALGTAGSDVTLLEPVAGLHLAPWASDDGGGGTIHGTF